jgi:hypothetical protein
MPGAIQDAREEDLPKKEGVIRVPWPCETRVLVEHIETALLAAPAASTEPYQATGRG